MDPEDLREIILSYHNCVVETTGRHNGLVAHTYGNTAVVYFGYPEAHEDDPERAVRAALELVKAVAALKTPMPLQTKVGIATGPRGRWRYIRCGRCAGEWGRRRNAEYCHTTPSDRRAGYRGCRRKHPKLLGNLFEFADLRTKDRKGIVSPVRAWTALRPSSAASRFEALHGTGLTDLVGREEELELLLRRWSRAKAAKVRWCYFPANPASASPD